MHVTFAKYRWQIVDCKYWLWVTLKIHVWHHLQHNLVPRLLRKRESRLTARLVLARENSWHLVMPPRWFPVKWCLRNECRNSTLMRHSTTHIWVMFLIGWRIASTGNRSWAAKWSTPCIPSPLSLPSKPSAQVLYATKIRLGSYLVAMWSFLS